MKVELTLQESKIRAVLEKKQEEVKDIEEKAGKSIKDRSEQIVKEKESILEALAAREKEINSLKENFADREKYLAGKVEEAEMDGKLALAKFDQELKEREKNLWVEREEWITVLKTQFKEKERELKEQLGKDRAAVEKREEELKGLFGQEKAALQKQLEQERGSLIIKEAEFKEAFEKAVLLPGWNRKEPLSGPKKLNLRPRWKKKRRRLKKGKIPSAGSGINSLRFLALKTRKLKG